MGLNSFGFESKARTVHRSEPLLLLPSQNDAKLLLCARGFVQS